MQWNFLYDTIYKLNPTISSLVTPVLVELTFCLRSERAQTVDERQQNIVCYLFIGMGKKAEYQLIGRDRSLSGSPIFEVT
jgi:hypothetical protein